MRASRKKLLRLDGKTYDRNNRHFYDDEEADDCSRKRRKPRYHSTSEEVFKCRHCHRFVCPPASGGHHRNHCPFCTEWTEDTVHSPAEGVTARKPRYKQTEEVFKCRHCHRFVCPPEYGSKHRNHCPFCLFSRHVDDKRPGDRMSSCGCSMEPVAHFQRPNGEYVIVHHCHGCDFERFNRIAADDDFDLVLSLPAQPPRTSREVKTMQVEMWLAEHLEEWDDDMEEVG